MELTRAKAICYHLTNKRPHFHNENLLAGTSTSKELGAAVYPELLGLSIWPELETIHKREANPQFLSKEDAGILNFEVFPYWMDRSFQGKLRISR